MLHFTEVCLSSYIYSRPNYKSHFIDNLAQSTHSLSLFSTLRASFTILYYNMITSFKEDLYLEHL